MKTNYLLSVSFLLAIIMTIIIADSCRKSDAKSSTASTILSSIKTIDVNSDFKNTNFVNLFANNKNVLIVSGQDTLCYAVGLTKNDKFISYDDQTKEEATTFTANGNDQFHSMVITATSHNAYINGGYKGQLTNVALFNTAQSPSALGISAYANTKATITKGYTMKNSKMSVYVIHNANTEKQTNTNAELPSSANDVVVTNHILAAERFQNQQNPAPQPTSPSPDTVVDVYKHMNWEYTTSKKEGEAGIAGDVYYRRGNKGYLEFYRAKSTKSANNVLPTNRMSDIAFNWEFLGPYEWNSFEYYSKKVGAVYVYDNPFNSKREFFKLKKYPYSWFPINKKSNEWWEYLGEDCASTIKVKVWYASGANHPIDHEVGWAWNNFIDAMKYVTDAFTYIRTYQGSYASVGSTQGNLDYIAKYVNKKEKFTIYGFLQWNPENDESVMGKSNFNSYKQGMGGDNPCFVAVTSVIRPFTLGHEIGHVLGASHNDEIYWKTWWWFIGIWYHDIMSSEGNGRYVRYPEHRSAENIKAMKYNLRETR